jgi:hypothetical protein
MRLAALVMALLASGCATSHWELTEKVSSNGHKGRLYVPKLYAPLRPGSIYPDKKVAVPAKGRPALVVACPTSGDCRKDDILGPASERGLVVLILERPTDKPAAAIDLLRSRQDADPARTGTLTVSPTSLKVFAPPQSQADAQPSSPSKQNLVLFATLHPADPSTLPEGAILKLYAARPSGGLPREAFRDAVEWLAGELGVR